MRFFLNVIENAASGKKEVVEMVEIPCKEHGSLLKPVTEMQDNPAVMAGAQAWREITGHADAKTAPKLVKNLKQVLAEDEAATLAAGRANDAREIASARRQAAETLAAAAQ